MDSQLVGIDKRKLSVLFSFSKMKLAPAFSSSTPLCFSHSPPPFHGDQKYFQHLACIALNWSFIPSLQQDSMLLMYFNEILQYLYSGNK